MSTDNPKKGFWASRNERERRSLIGMAIFFACLGTFLVTYFFMQKQEDTRDEIAKYESILKTLGQKGPDYVAAKAQKEGPKTADDKFAPEKLKKNNIQLTSFVATHAQAANIKVDNYDEDQLPVDSGKDGGPIITKKILRFDIKKADMSALLALLDRIEKSREPVIIDRINLRYVRRNKGFVRAYVHISTFVIKDQEG